MGDGQSLFQLAEHVALGYFVGMHLQAERVESDLGQTTLHHTEGGHLLGHEEYTLALEKRIGNQVGDGLRLAGSRRTVQDIRMSLSGSKDGSHL